jgi:hypothetical protein
MTAQAGKREFRIAGPRPPASNCMHPPQTRLQGAPALIGRDHVIIVHAPRRSGRTTCLAALAGEINSWGDR